LSYHFSHVKVALFVTSKQNQILEPLFSKTEIITNLIFAGLPNTP